MPRLEHLWIPVKHQYVSGIDNLVDLWEKQFPNIVLSCHPDHVDPIITRQNIAKSMSMEEKIWEIPCEGIKLSEIQEDDSEENKLDAMISDLWDDNSLSDFIDRALSEFKDTA